MNQPYDPPRRDQSGPADLAGFVVLGGCAVLGVFWYIAVSRLHLRSDQCLEIFLDLVIGIFGIALLLSHFIGRREKREEMWPHPAVSIPGAKDAAIVEAAIRNEATVLGYNVHKEPWLWPDSVRIKHDVFSAHQGVEDDDMNLFSLGGQVIGSALAWELIETFLKARFSGAIRHQRRVEKVMALEMHPIEH
jgi:hypothetical protein